MLHNLAYTIRYGATLLNRVPISDSVHLNNLGSTKFIRLISSYVKQHELL